MSTLRFAPVALAATVVAGITVAVASGSIAHATTASHDHEAITTADVAGFTRIGFADDLIVIVNVLPGEPMFTQEEFDREHPTVGELVLRGVGSPPTEFTRHIEAHIYARETGLPLTHPTPVIEVTRHDTNTTSVVGSILMQDVSIGEDDIHFGDNVTLPDDIDITIRVDLGEQGEVIIDGHID